MAILAISHVMKSITYKHQIHRFRVFRQSLRITQLLPFYRYESDISSFLEDDTVLSDMEVFDFEDSCFSSILESP
jgi:hypothetical protein